jgi:hypothetical protein
MFGSYCSIAGRIIETRPQRRATVCDAPWGRRATESNVVALTTESSQSILEYVGIM